MRQRRAWTRRPPVYDTDGYLSQEAIVKLVRRIWWGEYECVQVDGWRIKCARVSRFFPPAKWPPEWPPHVWVACPESFEAVFGGGCLCVRRR